MKELQSSLVLKIVTIVLLSFIFNEINAKDIEFIKQKPVIDGKRDSFLKDLTAHEFKQFYDFDNEGTEQVKVTYSLAYHQDGLYILFETDAKTLSYHKRGFLYGDGYKIIIGNYQATRRSKEFYEIVYSPTQLEEDEKYRQYIASYNSDGGARKLSNKTLSQETKTADGTSFETFLSWDDVYPYHPEFHSNIGINLYFAKGLIDNNKNYLTNGFAIVHDEAIWDEEIAYKALSKLSFSKRVTQRVIKPKFQFAQRTIAQGDLLAISILTSSKANHWKIINESTQEVLKGVLKGVFDNTISFSKSVDLPTDSLPAGSYQFKLGNEDYSLASALTFSILPETDFSHIVEGLSAQTAITNGTKYTLLHKIQSLYHDLDKLKSYEDINHVNELVSSINGDWRKIQNNQDPYQYIREDYLRAFHSKLDGSLQSYSIKLPKNYNPAKKYPLLVFLHGSGQDHISLLNRPRGNGDFIEIAPFGRDKFKAYAYQKSQIDIEEAIRDAIENFAVDKNKIVIGGFSMGGYGALLTFYRNPKLFKAIAIFAGHPNLANEWLEGIDSPNFENAEYLRTFKDTPIFIYHGTADPALSYSLMKKLSQDLITMGAKVTTSFVKDRGHIYQDNETQEKYNKWLKML